MLPQRCPYSNSLELGLVTLCGERSFLDLTMDLEGGEYSDSGEQEGQEIPEEEGGSERQDCWALKMEDGARAQKYGWPLEAENGRKTKSPR